MPYLHLTTAFSRLILLVIGASLFITCTEQKRNIKEYYFPVKKLLSGMAYVYASEEGDTSELRYWNYRAFVRDSGVYLVGTQYDRYFSINQIVREKLVESGSVAREAFLFEPDTVQGKMVPVPTSIESPDLFPFEVRDSLGIFLYKLQYHPPSDTTATVYLIRNRRYLGDGPMFEFNGEKYPTIRFGVLEAVGHNKDGSAELEGNGEEWYAKGLGLVYFRKSFGADNQIRFAFRLVDMFPTEELEHRASGEH
ncbi:MAG: hypothetical protein ACKVU2_07830 [Saprospiraceae bacterium]